MSSFPDDTDDTSEQPLSDICVNLEDKFVSMQDIAKGESMHVYARVRPMLDSEIEAGYKECIGLINEQIVRAIAPASSSKFKTSSHLCQDIIEDFTFTAAYGSETGQFVFFNNCMMDTMKNFLEGHNSLVFSYGTTGSGKTFTLQGNADNPGIIPLSLHLLFASIEDQLLDKVFFKPDKFSGVVALNDNETQRELEFKEQLLSACNQEEWSCKNSSTKSLGVLLCQTFSDHFESEERQTTLGPEEMLQAQAAALMKEISKKSAEEQPGYCSIWISFVEIYNETVYDLLQPNVSQRVKLNLGEDKNGDVYVKGLREVCVSNSSEALNLLHFGQRNLRIASTKLNYQSSRSHCIFTVKLIRIPDPENMSYAKVSRLSFCDLAGSERAAKSQTTGLRLKEAGCINTSLLVLGRCLEQLHLKPSLRDKKLIPFRESKLTRLFSGFFTGRGKAVMIANASPSELTFDETLHVLRFSAIAKKLIINDSYMTTASNTLQSIANMWTDAKNNYKNQSQSSDKSISFDDSMDEVVQEKDELIEKLLDLAESLRNKLEQEKKEKAELEIKIRQDLCMEYSEYRDELLSMQKQAFVEERDAIKEIYEKRIATMEERYEKIITDFKSELEESFISCDESSKDAVKTPVFMNKMELPESNENVENEDSGNCGSLSPSHNVTKTKSLGTQEELQKTVDYSLSLEVELEHLRKKYEDIQVLLENSMKENDKIKMDFQIDITALKTDNDSLLKDKLDLEADLKAFREDLVTVTQEKEALLQELGETKNNLSVLNNEIQNLLTRINELAKENDELNMKHKHFLEETYTNNQLKDQLLAVSMELEAETKRCEDLNSVVSDMKQKTSEFEALEQDNIQLKDQLLTYSVELETEKKRNEDLSSTISNMEKIISEFQVTEQDNIHLKKTAEKFSKEIDELQRENNSLMKKLEVAEVSILNSCHSESEVKNEIEKLKAVHQEDMEKLNISLRKHEADAKEAEEILKSLNKILGNSQEIIEEKNMELNLLQAECMSLKNELSKEQSLKDDIKRQLESVIATSETGQKKSELNIELEEKLNDQIQKFEVLQSDYFTSKSEIAILQKTNLDLEEKLSSSLKEYEIERQKKSELNIELEEKLNDQIQKFEVLQSDYFTSKSEIAILQKTNLDLEEKLSSSLKEYESVKNLISQSKSECEKCQEYLNTINVLKNEIEKLNCENKKCLDELVNIKEIKNELENKLASTISQKDNDSKMLQILENCEIQATRKIEELQSNLQELKDQLETSSVNHKQECIALRDLITILEKCEAYAYDKIKQFHSANIHYIEQIMDLEKNIEAKESVINVLSNDIKEIRKSYKELQVSSNKKLQVEVKRFKSEREEMEIKLNEYKKLNESLKNNLAEMEALKDKLESECETLKCRKETAEIIDEIQMDNRRNRKSAEQLKTTTENKKQNTAISQSPTDGRRNRKSAEQSETSTENKKQNTAVSESQIDGRRNRKSAEQPETTTENKKQNTAISQSQIDGRRNKKFAEQPETTTENKKQNTAISQIQGERKRNRKILKTSENVDENKIKKTEIYEEADEISSKDNSKQEKKTRRHLRCLSNVTTERNLVQNKSDNSLKNKAPKRKTVTIECKSPDQKSMKKIKVHNTVVDENSSKPENLRIKLLKSSVNVNDIPLPSPRMTRGRKRLFLAKENITSPRSVRS